MARTGRKPGAWAGRVCGVLLGVLGLAGPVQAQTQASLQKALDRFILDEGIPGGVLLVDRGGQPPVTVASGLATRQPDRPMRADGRFYTASIGKMLTAVAVLQLVEEGRVKLDEPAGTYLAGLAGIERIPNGREATIRQMLDHSAGLPEYYDDRFTSDLVRGRQWGVRDLLPYLYDKPALWRPGAGYEYTNTGYVLLGAVIEAVDGGDYAASLRRRVFQRAGMTDAQVGARGDEARLVRGYVYDDDVEDDDDDAEATVDNSADSWCWLTGDGSVVATAADMHKFLIALFRDRKLLGPAMLEAMVTPSATEPTYGLGVELSNGRQGRIAGHSGHVQGFEGDVRFALDRNVAVIVLFNGNQDSDTDFGADIMKQQLRR